MKIISKLLIAFILLFWILSINTSFGSFKNIFNNSKPDVHIDCWGWNCDIDEGVKIVKNTVTGIEKERSFSQYIQDIAAYLLWFISIIAVLYIIYAWFRILTGAWEEENLKNQKKTVIYVIIWMAVIWLAYPIVQFVIDVLNSPSTP